MENTLKIPLTLGKKRETLVHLVLKGSSLSTNNSAL